jgi:hypothetical protein
VYYEGNRDQVTAETKKAANAAFDAFAKGAV